MAKACEVPIDRVAGVDRFQRQGDTGCANATGNLVLALERARAGERIVVHGYGAGAGTVVAVLRAVADARGAAGPDGIVAPVELPYVQFLRHRGHLSRPPHPVGRRRLRSLTGVGAHEVVARSGCRPSDALTAARSTSR